MKVLHVLNELKPSGAEVMLHSAAPYWEQYGVKCEILATGKLEGVYAEALRKAGYPVHHLPRQNTIAYFRNFRRFLLDGKYNLVHQHAEGASYWFGLAALSAGVGLVRTVHSNFSFTGNLRLRRAWQRRHLKFHGARIVAIAPGVQQTEFENFGIKTDVVWNWIDINRFSPIGDDERAAARLKWGFSEKDKVLVSVGNCSDVKNHTAIIQALALIGDMPEIRYLHVGLEDNLAVERGLAKKVGVENRIFFCGWMENPREALAAADLYVMPSLYEGLGLGALEALSVGLPVLLTEVSGLKDIRDVCSDVIYSGVDSLSISLAIQEFFESDQCKQKIKALNNSKIVRQYFGVCRGVHEYVDIYKSI